MHITDRESDILPLVAEGLKNRDIADVLGVCEQTIKNQIRILFYKFDVRSRLQLVNATKEMSTKCFQCKKKRRKDSRFCSTHCAMAWAETAQLK